MNHWKCQQCKGYNDILNKHCIFCKGDKPSYITDFYQTEVEFRRGIYFSYGILGLKTMDDNKLELHARFFNEERILVKDMDLGQIRLGREKLELIALEAKARIAGRDAELRERQATMTLEQKSWLVPSEYDPNVSDAIGQVKERKKRQTAAEKTLETLKSLGVEGASEIVAAMERAQSPGKNNPSFNVGKPKASQANICSMCELNRHDECLKNYRDIKGNSVKCECTKHAEVKQFDPSELGF